jgi:membrane protein
VANFTDYEGSYGAVGGVIVVLLWLYVSGIALLVGAELNAEIEHASPYGKAPGQKNAEGKLLIGARASRAFQQRAHASPTVSPQPVRPALVPQPGPTLGAAVAGALMAARLWNRHRRPADVRQR